MKKPLAILLLIFSFVFAQEIITAFLYKLKAA